MKTDIAPIGTFAATRNPTYREEIQRRRDELFIQLNRILTPASTFTWELGCGHGHFLTAYAEAHPHKLCVGIDIVGERIERALRKRDRAKLDNLFFVRAEAQLFLDTLPEGASFSELFILFPDPWPKLRHRKHRIIQPNFLSAAAHRGTEKSQLFFRTDFRPYFEYAQGIVNRHPYWHMSDAEWPFEFCTVFQSRSARFDSLIARRTPTATPIIS